MNRRWSSSVSTTDVQPSTRRTRGIKRPLQSKRPIEDGQRTGRTDLSVYSPLHCDSGLHGWPRARRRLGRQGAPLSRNDLLFSVLCIGLSFLPIPVKGDNEFCWQNLLERDADANSWLDTAEFAYFLQYTTMGELDFFEDPRGVPSDITAVYVSGQEPGEGFYMGALQKGREASTPEEIATVDGFCSDLNTALYDFYGVDVSATCGAAAQTGAGTDDKMTVQEFTESFVQILSSGSVGGPGVSFDNLHPNLQAVFNAYADDAGQVTFIGETIAYADSMCGETRLTIRVMQSSGNTPTRSPGGGGTTPVPTPSPGTTAPPSSIPGATSAPSVLPGTTAPNPGGDICGVEVSESFWSSCRTAIIIGDANRDDQLSNSDYVRVLGRLVPGSFTGYTYEQLPFVFRQGFDGLAGDKGYVDVTGSKPSSQPTPEQTARLRCLCGVTEESIELFNNPPPTPGPGGDSPTLAPGGHSGQISDDFFNQCKIAMVLGDSNRDDRMVESEYIRLLNRLRQNEFSGTDFANLSPVFRNSYSTLSGDLDYIDVTGSKPGSNPSLEEVQELRAKCIEIDRSFYEYDNGGSGATNPPGSTGPTPSPTPLQSAAPTVITDQYFTNCKNSLFFADQNRDSYMDLTEYPRFLSRIMSETFIVPADISPILLFSFNTISKGDERGPSVAGSTPGSTTSQEDIDNLRFICEETKQAIDLVGNGFQLSDEQFQQCTLSMIAADNNADSILEPTEYTQLVNRLGDYAFSNVFDELPIIFRLTYDKAKRFDEFLSIVGVSSTTPTAEQTANLRSSCTDIFTAVDFYGQSDGTEGPDISICLSLLPDINTDDDSTLSKGEYVALVSKLSEGLFSVFDDLEELPFIVRDNFEWIKNGGSSVDISGLRDSANAAKVVRLCQRTVTVVEQARAISIVPGSDFKYCTVPVATADQNEDNLLNEIEFVSFINQLSGNNYKGKLFSDLGNNIIQVFDSAKNQAGLVAVDGARLGQTPSASQEDSLSSLCSEAEKAIQSARKAEFFFAGCLTALVFSDVDFDERLSKPEYTTFLYTLVGLDPAGKTYSQLDQVLRLNYDRITNRQSQVDIGGANVTVPTSEQLLNLQYICTKTSEVVDILLPQTQAPSRAPSNNFSGDLTTVTIYNAFIIANTKGYQLVDLKTGSNRAGLEDAYTDFVEDLIAGLNDARLRGRKLQQTGLVVNSPDVYRLEDSVCPGSAAAGSTCHVAFALFEIQVPVETEVEATRQAEQSSQDAIDAGTLQATLEQTDPGNELSIVGARLPTRPDSPDLDDDLTTSSAPGNERWATLPVMIGIAAGGAVLLFCLAVGGYFWYQRKKRLRLDPKPDVDDANPEGAQDSPYGDYDPALDSDIAADVAPKSGFGFEVSDDDKGFQQEGYDDQYGYEDEGYDGEEYGAGDEAYDDQGYGQEGYDEAYNQGYEDGHGYDEQGYVDEQDYDDGHGYDEQGYVGGHGYDEQGYEEENYVDGQGYDEQGYAEGDEYYDQQGQGYGQDAYGNQQEDMDGFGQDGFGQQNDFPEGQNGGEAADGWAQAANTGDGGAGAWGTTPAEWSTDNQQGVFHDDQPGDAVETSQSTESGGDVYHEQNHQAPSNNDSTIDAAGQAPTRSQREPEEELEPAEQHEDEAHEESQSTAEDESQSAAEDDTIEESVISGPSNVMNIRNEIIELVKQVVPDELDNVDTMMEQFEGREEELLTTLQNMAQMAEGDDGDSDEDTVSELGDPSVEGSDIEVSEDDESAEENDAEAEDDDSEYEEEEESYEEEEIIEEIVTDSEEEDSKDEEVTEESDAEYEEESVEEEITDSENETDEEGQEGDESQDEEESSEEESSEEESSEEEESEEEEEESSEEEESEEESEEEEEEDEEEEDESSEYESSEESDDEEEEEEEEESSSYESDSS